MEKQRISKPNQKANVTAVMEYSSQCAKSIELKIQTWKTRLQKCHEPEPVLERLLLSETPSRRLTAGQNPRSLTGRAPSALAGIPVQCPALSHSPTALADF